MTFLLFWVAAHVSSNTGQGISILMKLHCWGKIVNSVNFIFWTKFLARQKKNNRFSPEHLLIHSVYIVSKNRWWVKMSCHFLCTSAWTSIVKLLLVYFSFSYVSVVKIFQVLVQCSCNKNVKGTHHRVHSSLIYHVSWLGVRRTSFFDVKMTRFGDDAVSAEFSVYVRANFSCKFSRFCFVTVFYGSPDCVNLNHTPHGCTCTTAAAAAVLLSWQRFYSMRPQQNNLYMYFMPPPATFSDAALDVL